jgi:hypothetical protein
MFHDPELEQMWQYLRQAALFYLRHFEEVGDDAVAKLAFDAKSDEAQANLWKYSQLAEAKFGHLLCKPNLHKLNCQLPLQQRQRGHAAFYTEYWVEMLVQALKRFSKFRTTGCPELLMVNQLLLQLALDRVVARHPTVKTFDELVPGWGGADDVVRGSLLDNFDPTARCEGLLRSGTPFDTIALAEAALLVLTQHFTDFPPPDGQHHQFTTSHLLKYTMAHREGVELIHSQAYLRTRTRESFFVQVRYEEHVRAEVYRDVLYVARVKYFLGVMDTYGPCLESMGDVLPTKVDLVLRFAVADLFVARKVSGLVGDILEVADMEAPHAEDYPVLLSKIDHKVISCKPLAKCKDTSSWFLPYTHAPSDRS